MSKKSKGRKSGGRSLAPGREAAVPPRAKRTGYYVAAISALVLLSTVALATRYDSLRLAVGLRPLLAPAAPTPPAFSLAKEYAYVGDRLVATEEPAPAATPTPTPAGPPPGGLKATAASASVVRLEWSAPAGATNYVVERRNGLNAQPVEIPTNSNEPRFDDSLPVAGDFAYLYRVKAVFAAGFSEYSEQDLATTVVFTDDPIPIKDPNTRIKAAHLVELRRAVNAVRALAGVSTPASWTYPDPVSPPQGPRRKIYPEDVQELRTRLDEALGLLNLTSSYPADPPVAQRARVYAAHFEQIRACVK